MSVKSTQTHAHVPENFFFFLFMRTPSVSKGHGWHRRSTSSGTGVKWVMQKVPGFHRCGSAGACSQQEGVPMPIFRPTGHRPHCHRLVDSVCPCRGWAGPARPHGAVPGLGICAPKGPGRFAPGAPQVAPGPIWRLAICCCTCDRCNWAWPLDPNELLRNGLLQNG